MTHDEQRAAEANSRMARTDIEWAASKSGGIYLRDKDNATAANTRDIERRHERERQEWKRNQKEQ